MNAIFSLPRLLFAALALVAAWAPAATFAAPGADRHSPFVVEAAAQAHPQGEDCRHEELRRLQVHL